MSSQGTSSPRRSAAHTGEQEERQTVPTRRWLTATGVISPPNHTLDILSQQIREDQDSVSCRVLTVLWTRDTERKTVKGLVSQLSQALPSHSALVPHGQDSTLQLPQSKMTLNFFSFPCFDVLSAGISGLYDCALFTKCWGLNPGLPKFQSSTGFYPQL